MKCKDALAMMDAWMDGELTDERALQLERHIKNCQGCTTRARDLRDMAERLDMIRPAGLPHDLKARTISRFKEEVRSRHAAQKGQNKGWGLRMALGTGCLAGLWAGCLMGLQIISPAACVSEEMLDAFYFSGGLILSWA